MTSSTLTVTIRPDLERFRAGMCLMAAGCAYFGQLAGTSLTETVEESNARLTDARDTYWTARDAWEAVQ